MKKLGIKDMCYVAAFTAIIAIVSQISIPMPSGVPMTMQTFIIPLAAVILGTKRGTIASVIYVLVGMLGAPVFAGFVGGLEVAFGMTGGFILSFPVLAYFSGKGYSIAVKKVANKKSIAFYTVFSVGILIGTVINYLVGTLWFSFITGNSIMYSFLVCVVPYIVTTIVKIVLIELIAPVLRRTMVKSGILEVSI